MTDDAREGIGPIERDDASPTQGSTDHRSDEISRLEQRLAEAIKQVEIVRAQAPLSPDTNRDLRTARRILELAKAECESHRTDQDGAGAGE